MEFQDTLNLELSNNSKLAFELALNKLDATLDNPVDIRFLMFMYATNSKDLETLIKGLFNPLDNYLEIIYE